MVLHSLGVACKYVYSQRLTTLPHHLRVSAQANVSLSGDGYYYTTTKTIFAGWKESNGCTGGMTPYDDPYNGVAKMWCEGFQQCSGGDVIRCSWNGWYNA